MFNMIMKLKDGMAKCRENDGFTTEFLKNVG